MTLLKLKSLILSMLVCLLSISSLSAQFTKGTMSSTTPNKKASITFVAFHNSDNVISDGITDLFQNFGNDYDACFNDYDRTVLVKKTWNRTKRPDVHVKNNLKRGFFREIKKLADEGYYIDVFIFSHGLNGEFTYTKENGKVGYLKESEIRSHLYNYGLRGAGKFPIRAVYQMNCFGSTMNDAWLNVGAKVAVGSKYVNFYPTQFESFINSWNGGATFKNAVRNSNNAGSRTVVQSYMALRGATDGGCPNVLNKSNCAQNYFCQQWLCCTFDGSGDEWREGKSGKDNMNYSSEMEIDGNGNITKNTVPSYNGNTPSYRNSSGGGCDSECNLKTHHAGASGDNFFPYKNRFTNEVKLRVKKTEGKAGCTIKVYDITNGANTKIQEFTYPSGSSSIGSTRTYTINNARNKELKIKFDKGVTTNRFKFVACAAID